VKIIKSKDDGHSFLGCMQYNSYWLPSIEANDQWRLALLDRFSNILKKKIIWRRRKCSSKTIRVHTCPAPMAKFNEFSYKLFPHPTYSLDLVPCDYFLFPNLKKQFEGKRFIIREQLIAETEAYFEGLDKSYYSNSLKKLKNRWIKCIEPRKRLC